MDAPNDLSLLSLIVNASIPVQFVMLLLLGISILSWTYIFSKRAALRRAFEQTRRFEDDFWAGGDLTVLQQAVSTRRGEHGALARIFDAGMTEFVKARRSGVAPELMLDGPRRACVRPISASWTALTPTSAFLRRRVQSAPTVGF